MKSAKSDPNTYCCRIGLLLIFIFTVFANCKDKGTSNGNSITGSAAQQREAESDTALLAFTAELLYRQDRFDEASIEYGRLLKIDSLSGKFSFRKGYCLIQLDSPFEAFDYYLRAAKTKYKPAECYYVIGGIYASEGKDSLAIEFFERALSLEPNMQKANDFLATVKERNKASRL